MAKKKTLPNKIVKRSSPPSATTSLLGDLRQLIEAAREQTARVVNSSLVTMYWQIGKRIQQDVLQEVRAGYGMEIVQTLSAQLTAEYGQGFGRREKSKGSGLIEIQFTNSSTNLMARPRRADEAGGFDHALNRGFGRVALQSLTAPRSETRQSVPMILPRCHRSLDHGRCGTESLIRGIQAGWHCFGVFAKAVIFVFFGSSDDTTS